MSNSTLNKVKEFIDSEQLLAADGLHLVAISGGADSVALLLMLQQLGYQVEAVHCNFKLRGEESDRDEEFVRELCKKKDINLHITHFDTKEYAKIHKVSIEMAARQLRYTYFEQLLHDLRASSICIAHHQDDSVETILMNLIRGTGIHGLTGIKPRNGHIIRPLLCISRQDIRQWLIEQEQPFVDDSSNQVPDIMRNKLRLNVIPQLTAISAAATDSILDTAHRLLETEKLCQVSIRRAMEKLIKDDSIDISQLMSEPSPELLLYHWLSPLGFTPATIEAVSRRLPNVQAGRSWQSGTHLLSINQGRLIVGTVPRRERPTMVLPEPANYAYDQGREYFHILQAQGIRIERSRNIASLDANLVSFPLTLRPVRQGDRFQPYGMTGTKLISDFLADQKVPIHQRQQQLVLTAADGSIVWLVDHRPDGRFAITTETRKTLIINHQTEDNSTIT